MSVDMHVLSVNRDLLALSSASCWHQRAGRLITGMNKELVVHSILYKHVTNNSFCYQKEVRITTIRHGKGKFSNKKAESITAILNQIRK